MTKKRLNCEVRKDIADRLERVWRNRKDHEGEFFQSRNAYLEFIIDMTNKFYEKEWNLSLEVVKEIT